jgi:hypothetical protein
MEQNISKIKQRILQYAEQMHYSKRKIYLDTGIANGVFDKSTGLTEDNIERFISTYPEINPTWLITGKGNMIIESKKSDDVLKIPNSTPIYNKKTDSDHFDRMMKMIMDQSEEIGRLKTELDNYKRGHTPGAMYVGVADAG